MATEFSDEETEQMEEMLNSIKQAHQDILENKVVMEQDTYEKLIELAAIEQEEKEDSEIEPSEASDGEPSTNSSSFPSLNAGDRDKVNGKNHDSVGYYNEDYHYND